MISFRTVSAYPPEHLERNIAYSQGLGLPLVDSFEALGPLAIVGGGPSINLHKFALQRWRGTVFAVNRSWRWCWDNGIEAVFFSVDPNPSVIAMRSGAAKAIIGERCDPFVFNRTGETWLFDGLEGGPCSVGAAIHAGLRSKHTSITLFGCESSYQANASHAFGHFESADEMVVHSNGLYHLTTSRLLRAAIYLSQTMHNTRHQLKEESGGLLKALVETYGDYQIVECSPELEAKLKAAE